MENKSGIHPVNDLTVIKMLPVPKETASGIAYPPETVQREEVGQIYGWIVEMGPKCLQHPATSKAAPGQKVVIAKYAGIREKGIDDQWYRIVRAEDILAYAHDDCGVAPELRGRTRFGQTVDNQAVTA